MAQVIITKNGTGSATPTSLVQGELGLNVSTGQLFYGTSGSSNSVSSSYLFSAISVSGDIIANGHIRGDSQTALEGIKQGTFENFVSGSSVKAAFGFDVTKGNVTASGNINTTGIIQVEGVNSIDYISSTHLFGANSSFTKLRSTVGIEATAPITASGTISASGAIMTQDLSADTITNQTVGSGIVLDSAGFIGIDAGTGDVRFRVGGTNQLHFDMDGTAGAQVISPSVAGDDIIFKSEGGTSLLTLKSEGQTEIHGNLTSSGTVSASTVDVATNIKVNNMPTGVDNSVVILDSDNVLKTDEVQAAIFGTDPLATTSTVNESIEVYLTENPPATATLASTVNAVATTDNASFFVAILDGASGGQTVETSAKLKYNPSTFAFQAPIINATTNLSSSGNISASGIMHALEYKGTETGGITLSGNVTASGDISASGEIYSDTIETFWTSFNVDGDASFGSSVYGPNTQGINYYHWNKNWTSTTADGGNPTGDHVHRSEINSGWYVPYKIRIVELVGGFHDASATSTATAKMALYNTADSITSDYNTNTGTTKEFIVSGSVTLNGNRWKPYSQTCNVILNEGQYVFPRITMGSDMNNLRGQFTIKYKRCK